MYIDKSSFPEFPFLKTHALCLKVVGFRFQPMKKNRHMFSMFASEASKNPINNWHHTSMSEDDPELEVEDLTQWPGGGCVEPFFHTIQTMAKS